MQHHLRNTSLSNVPLFLSAKVRVLTIRFLLKEQTENMSTFVNGYLGGSSHVFRETPAIQPQGLLAC